MSIEIKKSEKPIIYEDAKKVMEERLLDLDLNKSNELIWTLEHPNVYKDLKNLLLMQRK